MVETALRAAWTRNAKRSAKPAKAIVGYALDWLKTNLKPGALDDMVDKSGYSRRQLERMFKSHTGMSPAAAQQIYRYLNVRDVLLRDGTGQISALAQDAHYSDQPHLTREFKKRTGISPKEYAKASTQRVYLPSAIFG